MKAEWGSRARRAALGVAAALAVASPTAAAPESGASVTARGSTVAFDVQPQDLGGALTAFADQAGLRLMFASDVVARFESRGLQGRFTREEALDLLLSDARLSWRFTSGSTVTISRFAPGDIVPMAAEGVIELDEIAVEGTGLQNAWGPVDGYVATRSATGSKTDTPLIETPRSISVIARDELADRGATTLQEALAYTPGVASFASGRSLVLDEFLLRGFDTAAGNLGQLRDGLKLQANVYDGAQEPYGLERVEVLKGAASILYGQLGPGGVVNSISKRPTFTPQGEINVTGGSFENKQVSADVSGPIGSSGEWAYRLTGLVRDGDTWMDYVPDDKRYIAPAITWRPTDRTSLTVLAHYQEVRTRFKAPMDADGTVFRAPGVGRVPRDMFIGDPDFDKYKINSGAIGYLFEHDFNGTVKFSSKTRYFESKADWNYLTFLGFKTTAPGDPQILRGISERTEHSKTFTSDNNFQVRFDTGPISHTAVVGVDYSRLTYDTHRFQRGVVDSLEFDDPDYGNSGVKVDYSRDNGFKRQIGQVGVYAQDQIKIADRFVILAGGRQDWAKTETSYYRLGRQPDQKDDAFSAQLGFVYLAPHGFAPYVSYSESFSPTVAANFLEPSTKPTTGEQYEAGLRWQSPDEKTLITAAAYTIDQKNAVSFAAPTNDDDSGFRQTGLVRSRGVELEAKTKLGDWEIVAAYAYTDARVRKDEDPLLVGERVALVPYNQASIWAAYDFTSLGAPWLKLGGGLRYVGRTNLTEDYISDANGAPIRKRYREVPDYLMVDAVARLDLGGMTPSLKGFHAQINAKNLLDKKTYSCTSAVQGCNYGQPRTIFATLSYKW
ncbi:TonB-dependent siderophore receptor [Methylopila sp. 73B]|uniref:TonB-dependent siderophore receptor n=1 Tax=Methylopila sp. 73B TaxID=1120792 RepID=UPI001FDA3467|nr:TonB-dependent siderophore receptor [Methylopila sp. 73B]